MLNKTNAPIDIIFHGVQPEQELINAVDDAFFRLPKNVQENLHRHLVCKRPAKVIFYAKPIKNEDVRKYLVRTPINIIKKSTLNKKCTNGEYFHADNGIFISMPNNALGGINYVLNHEFGHLVYHHNLTRFKNKWIGFSSGIPKDERITLYSGESAAEHFADTYALYTDAKDEYNFMITEVFEENNIGNWKVNMDHPGTTKFDTKYILDRINCYYLDTIRCTARNDNVCDKQKCPYKLKED